MASVRRGAGVAREAWAGDVAGNLRPHGGALCARAVKPFSHIVVDESQDLGVAELRFLAAIAPSAPDALFFAGDLGPAHLPAAVLVVGLGVDVRGRSSTLTVNYRTSHQIRRAADRLLPNAVRDVDGNADERNRTVSVFNGPPSEVLQFDTEQAETAAAAGSMQARRRWACCPRKSGCSCAPARRLPRARAAVEAAGLPWLELSERDQEAEGQVSDRHDALRILKEGEGEVTRAIQATRFAGHRYFA